MGAVNRSQQIFWNLDYMADSIGRPAQSTSVFAGTEVLSCQYFDEYEAVHRICAQQHMCSYDPIYCALVKKRCEV